MKETTQLPLRLDAEKHAKLRVFSVASGMSMNQVIETALDQFMDRNYASAVVQYERMMAFRERWANPTASEQAADLIAELVEIPPKPRKLSDLMAASDGPKKRRRTK
jgi:hypothetical protein